MTKEELKENSIKELSEHLAAYSGRPDVENYRKTMDLLDTITDKAYEAGINKGASGAKKLTEFNESLLETAIQKSTAEDICEMIMGKMSYTEKGLINREDLVEKIREKYELQEKN